MAYDGACNTKSIEMSATLPSSGKVSVPSSLYFILFSAFFQSSHQDADGADTFRESKSLHARPRRSKHGACAQALRASKARGLPLGHRGHSQSQGSSSSAPWHRGSFLAGRRMSASEVKGPKKIARSMLTCPPGSVESVTWRMVCSRKKKSSACLPYFFASLKLLAAARTLMTWKALRKGHRDSHKGPPSPFCSSIFGGKFCSLIPRAASMVCALCISAFAVCRHFVAFTVLRLQVRLHQPPTQEVTRDLYCARLARAEAPASCSRKDAAAGHLLRMVTHGLRMPSLTCRSMTTSLSSPKRSWASQKWPATTRVSLEMAVCTLVACDSIDQILTCDPSLGSGLSFACGRARARGEQPCLRHRERLFSSGRHSDGSRFYTRNEGSDEFLFRASGRNPNVQMTSVGAQCLRDLTTSD